MGRPTKRAAHMRQHRLNKTKSGRNAYLNRGNLARGQFRKRLAKSAKIDFQ